MVSRRLNEAGLIVDGGDNVRVPPWAAIWVSAVCRALGRAIFGTLWDFFLIVHVNSLGRTLRFSFAFSFVFRPDDSHNGPSADFGADKNPLKNSPVVLSPF